MSQVEFQEPGPAWYGGLHVGGMRVVLLGAIPVRK